MDKKGIEFHIAVQDYFGTLATVLSLCSQNLRSGRLSPEEIAGDLSTMTEELSYLQKHYRIEELGPQELENVVDAANT
jgi:hypothetical protein